MKYINLRILAFFILTTSFSSCKAIADIFKAGVNVGIFIAILVVVIIIAAVMSIAKK